VDGRSYEPYPSDFNNILKRCIRKRDNYTCQKCYKTQKQELITINKKLSIHHIDYNKFNCSEFNLITLCNKCNHTVNSNRDYWFAYFIYAMENK